MSPARSPRRDRRRPSVALREFLENEVAGAVLLSVAVVAALVWANSPWSESYHHLIEAEPAIGGFRPGLDVHAWVNDGLMALFFLVVGLEIRRELTVGELASPRRAALPAVAALGGMVVPALLFVAVVGGTDGAQAWGVPMATDIALALGVVTALGSRLPSGAKVFLLALAIVDDLGAILVIALVYSDGIRWGYLLAAAAALVAVQLAGRLGMRGVPLVVVLAVVLWWCTHESGIHATLAGVALAWVLPAHSVEDVMHAFHTWTSRLVVPLFALLNAGVVVDSTTIGDAIDSRAAIGIAVGLLVGKPLGITLAVAAGRRFGLELPDGMTLSTVAALGAVAGIGFTVAIFVADLAFDVAADADAAKLAIIVASLAAAAVGGMALLRADGGDDEDTAAATG